ncbi:MAG: hypothetical protein M3Y73_20195 [Actinomycetota bacterium]|nr:hypothetical protein [Actinomycetota bacterium]
MSWKPRCAAVPMVRRSKSPPLIRQEIYPVRCCYPAIRALSNHAAGTAGLDPGRISFTRASDAPSRP